MEGRETAFTFQGMPTSPQMFTHNPDDIYFPLNKTYLQFSFTDRDDHRFQDTMKLHKIESEADYVRLLPLFSAVPDFTVSIGGVVPDLDHFEYRTSMKDPWKKLNEPTFHWNLGEGENLIETRAVNRSELVGPVTRMRIDYR
jgi:hypothetical protein